MPRSYHPPLKLLSPLVFVYRWGVFFRRFLVKGKIPPLPVISVGNIAFGGTGKTPVVIHLARLFSGAGLRVGVGTRGFKGKGRGTRVYPPNQEVSPQEAGDEAAVLRENLPELWIFVGRRREELARRAEREGLDLLILDDGFQYLGLKKIEVVLHSPEIKGYYLREAERALNFAHLVLVPPGHSFPGAHHYRLFPLDVPREEVFAFCGIGRPERFVSLFPRLKQALVFPDHHTYSSGDLERIYELSGGLPIYTTEKDLVKIRTLPNFRGGIRAVKWRAEVDQEAVEELKELLKSWPSVLK